jgi:hypothetical protein
VGAAGQRGRRGPRAFWGSGVGDLMELLPASSGGEEEEGGSRGGAGPAAGIC